MKGAGRKVRAAPHDSRLSEEKLECELDDARTPSRSDDPEVSTLRKISVTEVISRRAEVHVVEKVKELRAELQLHLLSNGEILDRTEVGLEESGSPESVLPGVSECSNCVGHEFRGIEITRNQLAVRTAGVELGIPGNIGPVSPDAAKRVVLAAINRKRKSAAPGGNGIDEPPVHDGTGKTVDVQLRDLPDVGK